MAGRGKGKDNVCQEVVLESSTLARLQFTTRELWPGNASRLENHFLADAVFSLSPPSQPIRARRTRFFASNWFLPPFSLLPFLSVCFLVITNQSKFLPFFPALSLQSVPCSRGRTKCLFFPKISRPIIPRMDCEPLPGHGLHAADEQSIRSTVTSNGNYCIFIPMLYQRTDLVTREKTCLKS